MNHNVKIIRLRGAANKSHAYGSVYEYTYPEPLPLGERVEIMFGGGRYEGEITDKPACEDTMLDREIKAILYERRPNLTVVV